MRGEEKYLKLGQLYKLHHAQERDVHKHKLQSAISSVVHYSMVAQTAERIIHYLKIQYS